MNETAPQLLEFANVLADAAAGAALPFFRAAPQIENKLGDGGFDPVTEGDKAAERAMRVLIEQTFPHHGIIGEEEDDRPASDSPYSWILDPIDGTRAFMAGIPLWGTLIGLRRNGVPVLGMLDQGYIGERWFAGAAASGFQNRHGTSALASSACTDLADAVLASTHPEIFATIAEQAAFGRVSDQVKLLRWGGDCYSYGLLALGTIDLVVEASLQAYDIQPLIPIVEAAGGVITNWQGGDAAAGGRIVAAATPQLHEAALALLQS